MKGAAASIVDNPVHAVLSLCRVLLFLEEGYIASKDEGGRSWKMQRSPSMTLAMRPGGNWPTCWSSRAAERKRRLCGGNSLGADSRH